MHVVATQPLHHSARYTQITLGRCELGDRDDLLKQLYPPLCWIHEGAVETDFGGLVPGADECRLVQTDFKDTTSAIRYAGILGVYDGDDPEEFVGVLDSQNAAIAFEQLMRLLTCATHKGADPSGVFTTTGTNIIAVKTGKSLKLHKVLDERDYGPEVVLAEAVWGKSRPGYWNVGMVYAHPYELEPGDRLFFQDGFLQIPLERAGQ